MLFVLFVIYMYAVQKRGKNTHKKKSRSVYSLIEKNLLV